ncbi:GNAT family N-acetyltransferase [Roseomonas sp. SSH11]|uniref:GNAT family N-acetyltransferase n=1 Tax=Pararoseomonas baculiformis TaxID=2820812 RepID=A0ABS4AHP5_9PROT|nr:GNAT family N-acetyltransferase [Pararoseomonas baculiformis]MBP0445734.1 GNAT family N-acetyltransferase [Pararoseomonas baculiformis]
MNVFVRPAGHSDTEGLAALLGEMQAHYGAPVSDAEALETARLLCSLPPEGFNPRTLLAIEEDVAIGSCVLNVMIPAAELRSSLYIRDLFVSARARRRGTGRALVSEAARLVRDGGFCALDWTTDAQNMPARRLYDSAGGRVIGRTYYRIERGALGGLLGEDTTPAGLRRAAAGE